MQRADICSAEDYETMDRLQAVLAGLGIVADDSWHDSSFGLGLTRYRKGEREISVFRDAWVVDIAGPDDLVNEVLAALRE
jgi:hypothetical protein